MGASKKGDIKELAEISNPTHGLITNIGKAHLEGFGDIETIRQTKLELYQNIIKNKGEIIVNNDDDFLTKNIPKNITKHTYGLKSGNIQGKVTGFSPTINASIEFKNEEELTLSSNLLGAYNLLNILAGAAVGKIFNLKNSKIVLSIENYIPSNNRSQLVKSSKNIIIADCYNANPTSTLESLISLNSMEGSNKIVILGDMLELGEQSENEHQLIVDFLKQNNLKSYLVGSCYNATESNFNKFDNTLVLIEHLKKTNLKGNTILLKGSRGIQLEEIINQNIL